MTAATVRPAPSAAADGPSARPGGSAPTLIVDLGAVAANTRLLSDRCGGRLMAVVKADGYGLGAVDVARTALANGASWLGATSLLEGLQLRAAGLGAPLLCWLNPVAADWAAASAADVDVAVPGLEHLAAVRSAAARSGRPARIHLHADVGLARDGAPASEWRALARAAAAAERVGEVAVVGAMAHLARADDGPDRAGREAFREFTTVLARAGLRPGLRHLAATSAVLTDPPAHHDLCRVGAGLVGIDPSGTARLQGAARLEAPVVSVREVPAGAGVGYGHGHVTDQHTRLALLPLGYADGLPRAVSGRAQVLLAGRRCALVGRVSMDQVVVDVGDAPASPGDVATVFGPGGDGEPTLADWAGWAGTNPHEIITGLGRRIHRVVGQAGPAVRPAVPA